MFLGDKHGPLYLLVPEASQQSAPPFGLFLSRHKALYVLSFFSFLAEQYVSFPLF